MIEELREVNQTIIDNCKNNKERNKHILIGKILNDDKCFFKMSIEDAYALLRELYIEEDNLKTLYISLIDKTN